MKCAPTKYFNSPHGLAIRLNQILADPSAAPVFTFKINKPFVPIGWLFQDFDFIGQIPLPGTPAAASGFFANLQELALSMAFSNKDATETTPGPSVNGVVYTSGDFAGYMKQFLNPSQAPINEESLIAMSTWFADFWLTELALFNGATSLPLIYGIPPETFPIATYPTGSASRLAELCERIIEVFDLRLFIPPGIYTCDGTNGVTDLNNIFNNVNIGGSTNLNIAVLELVGMPG